MACASKAPPQASLEYRLKQPKVSLSNQCLRIQPQEVPLRDSRATNLRPLLIHLLQIQKASNRWKDSGRNTRPSYAKTGSSLAFAPLKRVALSLTAFTSSTLSQTCPRTIRLSSASASTKSSTAPMAPDASSGTVRPTSRPRFLHSLPKSRQLQLPSRPHSSPHRFSIKMSQDFLPHRKIS